MKKYIRFAAFTAGTTLVGTWTAAAQEVRPAAGSSPDRSHVVVAGDRLAGIAPPKPTVSDRWAELFTLNGETGAPAAVLVAVRPLVVKAAPSVPAPTPDPAPAITHTVAAGEDLSAIAQARLGTWERWVEIFAVNQGVLASPHLLRVGQVLDIPSERVAVPDELLATLATARTLTNRSAVSSAQASSAQAASGSAAGDGRLASIRACESSSNYGAVSASGQYRGAYQFDIPTWQSVGGSGDPAAASPAEQDARASQLLSQRGSSPWPNCG